MRDFARHQELQRVLGAGVVAEIDQPLVDDLRAGFGGDVAAQIDVELAGDLQVVGGPGVAQRIEEVTPPPPAIAINGSASAASRSNFIGLRCMRASVPDDFEMAQFLGADIHQQIFAVRIFAVQALDRILHGGGEFAIRAAELLKQHVAETRIGLVDADRVHKFLDVVIHGSLSVAGGMIAEKPPRESFVPNGRHNLQDAGKTILAEKGVSIHSLVGLPRKHDIQS